MPDFNTVLTPGAVSDGRVNTVVEIPEGSPVESRVASPNSELYARSCGAKYLCKAM